MWYSGCFLSSQKVSIKDPISYPLSTHLALCSPLVRDRVIKCKLASPVQITILEGFNFEVNFLVDNGATCFAAGFGRKVPNPKAKIRYGSATYLQECAEYFDFEGILCECKKICLGEVSFES